MRVSLLCVQVCRSVCAGRGGGGVHMMKFEQVYDCVCLCGCTCDEVRAGI